jgi:hypothetical protein
VIGFSGWSRLKQNEASNGLPQEDKKVIMKADREERQPSRGATEACPGKTEDCLENMKANRERIEAVASPMRPLI